MTNNLLACQSLCDMIHWCNPKAADQIMKLHFSRVHFVQICWIFGTFFSLLQARLEKEEFEEEAKEHQEKLSTMKKQIPDPSHTQTLNQVQWTHSRMINDAWPV